MTTKNKPNCSVSSRSKASLESRNRIFHARAAEPITVKESACKFGQIRCRRYFSPACYALEMWAINIMDWEPFARFETKQAALFMFKQSVKRLGGVLKGGAK